MKSIRTIIMLSVSVLTASIGNPLFAQMHENVAVEGLYEPVVIETERISTYPAASKFELQSVDLQTENAGIVTDFQPSLLTMGFSGWRTSPSVKKQNGYLDINLGSWLNSNVSAGCRLLNDSSNTLDLALQFNSTSLYKIKNLPEGITPLSRRYLYDGTVSAGWRHYFTASKVLSASLAYRLAHFDYYGTVAADNSPLMAYGAPAQTLNDITLDVNFGDTPILPHGWHSGLGMRYFGYNSFYPVNFATSSHISGGRELQLSLIGGYHFPLKGRSSLILDAEGDLLIYNKPSGLEYPLTSLDNYGMVTLKPSYFYNKENFDVRAGLVVDLTFNAYGFSGKYSLVHAAPDIQLNVRRGKFGFRLGATGGSRLQTLAAREQYDYYQMPYLLNTQPSFTALDAVAGFNFGPFGGFSADISAGWESTLHIPQGGWYQIMLGGYSSAGVESLNNYGTPYFDLSRKDLDIAGAKVNLQLNYVCKNIFDASVALSYSPQRGDKGVFNGFDRPRWILDAQASIRPSKRLRIDLGYNYRGVRNIYTYVNPPMAEYGQEVLKGVRLKDISDLNAKVTVSVNENVHIYCRGANLLNRHIEILPGLQSQGITFCGGFDLIF